MKKKMETSETLTHPDPLEWIKAYGVKSTEDVELPKLLIDEVIGQEEAVATAKKAARQGRHLLLLGDPGTGKSMIAKAMAQILPDKHLNEVLVHPNPNDENQPLVQTVGGGQGREMFRDQATNARIKAGLFTALEILLAGGIVGGAVLAYFLLGGGTNNLMLIVMAAILAVFFIFVARQAGKKVGRGIPNLLIERPAEKVPAPYVDATGSMAGALLGDVRHDPYQSGGLETPTHLRVEAGAIHKADGGLLFIDEINVLRLDSQQALLTAMQEKKYAITGQSDSSSGAMVRTQAVPCDFILVAAGNMDVIDPDQHGEHVGLHPALRSRIRGYGYEVYVRSVMNDTDANRVKLVRFVAQEVRRDGQIPHLDKEAISEIIREAQRRSGHTGKLTLRLRELGGLVRTAGDIARDDGRDLATVKDVLIAKRMSQSLEYQVTRRGIEVTTAAEAFITEGQAVGTAVGSTFMGTGETGEPAGIVVPIEANVTSTQDRQRGQVLLSGTLRDGDLADNVSALLKQMKGADMAGMDVHAQAFLKHRGAEVDSLGAATTIACISAMERIPVRRDTLIIGDISVSGRMRSVDGVTQMIEGAADLGYKRCIVPAANEHDILLEFTYRGKIDIVFAETLADVAQEALAGTATKRNAITKALDGAGAVTVKARR